ncbi:hydroxyacid dehydrogenase [Azohydromonas australica]|uniref:hydroxyacid dehydrogenase n=1 Tax=Azohydromonas australica TaxID=364039 RepID=UPI00040B0F0B|nr:hydroxyacid dehydrogenase [Azohydromonas australica]
MSQDTIVVTAANIHPDAVALLSDYRVVYADVRAGETALAELCGQEQPIAIMVRYGNISEKVISASSKLKVIAKHGVGTDNIDKVAAARLSIPVTAALGSNSQAVAEQTLALMFACARQIAWLDTRMRQGHWDKDNYAGIELAGATLGLIGAGSIGRRVAQVALALGMKVVVHDPYAIPGSLPTGVHLVDLEPLLAQANVISLHCPLTPETRNLLDADRLAKLQDQTIIVNTARAGLFDEAALLAELHARRLHAGIDCFQEEPLGNSSPWLVAPNTILTPHIGGTTTTAFRQMGVMAAESILSHLNC